MAKINALSIMPRVDMDRYHLRRSLIFMIELNVKHVLAHQQNLIAVGACGPYSDTYHE